MLVILEGGGIDGGGVNFDAKLRRNSTDTDDLFHAHIGSMDAFARGLMIANEILEKSEYKAMRKARYMSFDAGKGKDFEEGKLTLEDLRDHALASGEPQKTSGKQERYENILNQFI
jgi:xylose isomerase